MEAWALPRLGTGNSHFPSATHTVRWSRGTGTGTLAPYPRRSWTLAPPPPCSPRLFAGKRCTAFLRFGKGTLPCFIPKVCTASGRNLRSQGVCAHVRTQRGDQRRSLHVDKKMKILIISPRRSRTATPGFGQALFPPSYDEYDTHMYGVMYGVD